MKHLLPLFLLGGLLSAPALPAQIPTREAPAPGFEKRIRDHVFGIQMIDTHEHLYLMYESYAEYEEALANESHDFTQLFKHYLLEDLTSAGMHWSLQGLLYNRKLTPRQKWEIVKPVWERTRNTGYARVALIAAQDLFGFDDINDDTVEPLSARIDATIDQGWNEEVLKRAGIEMCIVDLAPMDLPQDRYRHVTRFDDFVFVHSFAQIEDQAPGVTTLEGYLQVLEERFREAMAGGSIGVKSGLAYGRTIRYRKTPEADAAEVFAALAASPNKQFSFKEVRPLQDYVMHQVVRLAGEHKVPMQIHTGHLAGNGNILTNSKPTHLVNLFLEYPKVQFCVFHSAYPYGAELGSIAKNFPNVYIDMCWSAVISPSYSKRYLHEWLETVPASKIMAFGGDYFHIEGTYGHAVMAREIVAAVLTEKVADQYFTEAEAMDVANRILRENALEIFAIYPDHDKDPLAPVLSEEGLIKVLVEMARQDAGFINQWQVIGPFDLGTPNPYSHELAPGFDTAYPPETELDFAQSYAGPDGNQLEWKAVQANEVNFIEVLDSREAGIAYAYTELLSPDERKVTLTLGSDDGVKVWLNGELVHRNPTWRSLESDEDFIECDLLQGTNRLLFKVSNRGLNWGLMVRILDPDAEVRVRPVL